MRQVKLDVHTHTIASGHAYGTLTEMCKAAADKGLEVYGIAEHGPAMEGACEAIYFSCYSFVPRDLFGLKLLLGCEMNILDDKGKLDLDQKHIDRIDLRIAGIHANKLGEFKQRDSIRYNTDAYLKAIMNPDIDIISHPDAVDADYEELCHAAMEYHTLLEINNNTLNLQRIRPHARHNVESLLRWAKKLNMEVILGSDAHYMTGIGDMSGLEPMLKEIDFPEELIINYRPDDFLKFINSRK